MVTGIDTMFKQHWIAMRQIERLNKVCIKSCKITFATVFVHLPFAGVPLVKHLIAFLPGWFAVHPQQQDLQSSGPKAKVLVAVAKWISICTNVVHQGHQHLLAS